MKTKNVFVCGLALAIGCLAIIYVALAKRQLRIPDNGSRDQFVHSVMEYADIPGMALVTIKAGKIEKISSYGYADIANKVPVTKDTLFNIASISKPLLGILLIEAERNGTIDLDKDVNAYLPFKVVNPKAPGGVITLRSIASHTSGIADFFSFDFYCFNKDCDEDIEKYLSRLLDANGTLYDKGKHYLPHQPGQHWEYSNLATALAGYILERQSGKTLDQLSSDVVFKGLLGTNASWKLNGLDQRALAVQYEIHGCVPVVGLCFDPQSPSKNKAALSHFLAARFPTVHQRPYPPFGNPQYPDGGVRTSITGLGNMIVGLLSNQSVDGKPLLAHSTYDQMFALQTSTKVKPGQRFFWRHNDGDLVSNAYIGHLGADYGLFTALFFNRETKDGFAVVMNRGIDDMSWQAMAAIGSRFKAGKL
jgi:CubicO group peptidase (beta-lactamase class C family)